VFTERKKKERKKEGRREGGRKEGRKEWFYDLIIETHFENLV